MKTKINLLFCLCTIFTLTNCDVNLDSTEPEYLPKQLTISSMDREAFLSPNGKNIVFYSTRNTYNPYASGPLFELWAMERDGSNQRVLVGFDNTNEHYDIEFLKWSSDSDYIIALLKGKEIWKINLNGDKLLLHSFDQRVYYPLYSPDDKMIAYEIFETYAPNKGRHNLLIADADFSRSVLVDTFTSGFDWTKNSEELVYLKSDVQNENNDIWKVTADIGTKVRVSSTPDYKRNISCSKLNNLVLFTINDSVLITPPDEFSPRFVLENNLLLSSWARPRWVNNRDLILIVTEHNKSGFYWQESWVVDLHGNIVRKIAPGINNYVEFSENGHYFLYTIQITTSGGSIWLDYLP